MNFFRTTDTTDTTDTTIWKPGFRKGKFPFQKREISRIMIRLAVSLCKSIRRKI